MLELLNSQLLGTVQREPFRVSSEALLGELQHFSVDLNDIRGQQTAKRALEVSAAGRHNILIIGLPGSGKTMLAKRLPSILAPLSFEEALETTKIDSVAGVLDAAQDLVTQRPFRSPHHTISDAGLIGGALYAGGRHESLRIANRDQHEPRLHLCYPAVAPDIVQFPQADFRLVIRVGE